MREDGERYGLDRLTTAGLIAAAIVVAITIMVLYRVLGVLMDEANERDAAGEEMEALKAEEYQKFLEWEARRGHAEGAGGEAETGGEG